MQEHIIITCHGSVSFDVYGGKDKIREFTSPHIDEDGRNEDYKLILSQPSKFENIVKNDMICFIYINCKF
jgi:hypothetical protein